MAERIIQIDSVDAYNKLYGWETLHPLVTVVNHANPMASDLNHSRLNYGLYALFLKQGDGCSIRYGREKYDYQEGTVVSFKPGQVVEVEWDESRPMPPSRGLLFHPDLLYGTQLARRINDYTFFDYDQREALHLSEREQHMVVELFDRIEEELQHPIDRHSQTLITDAIGLLLDYCMRYYDRQFITRHKVNSEVFLAFQQQLKDYFLNGHPERNGLPTVAYFADKACLSPTISATSSARRAAPPPSATFRMQSSSVPSSSLSRPVCPSAKSPISSASNIRSTSHVCSSRAQA